MKVLLVLLVLSISAVAQNLPNKTLTPGDVASTDVNEVCSKGYSPQHRNVSYALRQKVFAEYGLTKHRKGRYEIDHLIPLSLGGSNDIKNLWPQSYRRKQNALKKDALELTLRSMVCDHKVDLKTAQHDITDNWIKAYDKYVGHRVKKKS